MESSWGNGFDIHVPVRMPLSPGLNTDASEKQAARPGSRAHFLARLLKPQSFGSEHSRYHAIPLCWLCPGRRIPFRVYERSPVGEIVQVLQSHRIYIPWAGEPDRREESPRVFMEKESTAELLRYLDENLDEIVSHPRITPSEKAEVFYYLSYRRLEFAYRNPGRPMLTGVKNIIALMIEQIIPHRETLRRVYALIQESAGRISEHPRSTILHSLNVGILSTFFVRVVLGHLSRETVEDIALGYFFHDIGMMRLPREVINHRGPLSDDSWSFIRQHPRWGIEIMSRERNMTREMSSIILEHHERLDGKGYPRSLKATDLHFFVKTCAIMDALDAMISLRAYRQAFPLAEALKEIRHNVHQSYDPGIFSRLITVFRENELL